MKRVAFALFALSFGLALAAPTASQVTTTPATAPRMWVHVDTAAIQVPLGVLIYDPAGNQAWSQASGGFVSVPAPPWNPGFIAACLVPLNSNTPVSGVASALINLPGAPPTSLAIYTYSQPVNEVQAINASKTPPTAGSFTVQAQFGTGSIPWNATAAQAQAAFDAAYGAGNSVVTGGPLPGTPLTIAYQGLYAARDVAYPTLDTTGLTGGTVGVGMITQGQPLVREVGGLSLGYAAVPAGGTSQTITINAGPAR